MLKSLQSFFAFHKNNNEKRKRQVNPAGWVIDGCKSIYLKPVAWLWLIFFNTLNVSLLFTGAWSASRSGQDSSSIHNFFFHTKQPASVWQESKRYPHRLGEKYAKCSNNWATMTPISMCSHSKCATCYRKSNCRNHLNKDSEDVNGPAWFTTLRV